MAEKEKDFWYYLSEEGQKEALNALEKIFNNPIPETTRRLEEEIKRKIDEEEKEEWEEHEKMIEGMMKI